MACRRPVIATNVGGVKDIVKNNLNGFCIKLKEKKKFEKKLILLIKSKVLRDKFGKNGFKFVYNNYSFMNLVNKMRRLYFYEIKKKNCIN